MFIVCSSPCVGSLGLLAILNRDGLSASHLLDRDGAPLGARAVGGERDDERGAGLGQRARARAAVAHRRDERRELGAVGGLEALDEVRVAAAAVAVAAPGSTRAERAARIDADGDAVAGAEDLEPDVVAERVVARAREDRERAAAEPQHRRRRVDVAVVARTTRVSRTAPSA